MAVAQEVISNKEMAKGNDGSAARRRTMRKFLIAAGVALGVTYVILNFGQKDGHPRTRIQGKAYEVSENGFDSEALTDPLAIRKDLIGDHNVRMREEVLEGILNGSVNLVSILGGHNLRPSNDGSYQGVGGKFCKINFALHKNDPSNCKFIVSSLSCPPL